MVRFIQSKYMAEITIGNRIVGDGHPVFVIAEIGINHNGSMDVAKKLIELEVGECALAARLC